MPQLTVYFNELSHNDTWDEAQWRSAIHGLIATFDAVLEIDPLTKLGLSNGVWDSLCGTLPLRVRIKDQLASQDRFRVFLRRISQLGGLHEQLLHEIRYAGQATVGLTLAWTSDSWCISFCDISKPHWTHSTIPATLFDAQTGNSQTCNVKNLSQVSHITTEIATQLRDWGKTPNASSVIDEILGHPIVMYSYPDEHEPPHIHVLSGRTTAQTIARYRLDVEPPQLMEKRKGDPHSPPQNIKLAISTWISQYKEQLLRSWERCARGGHPYQLEK